jgi:hypothetical protein
MVYGAIVASFIPIFNMINYWCYYFDPSDLSSLFTFQGITGFSAFIGILPIVAIILTYISWKQCEGQ